MNYLGVPSFQGTSMLDNLTILIDDDTVMIDTSNNHTSSWIMLEWLKKIKKHNHHKHSE